MPAAMSQKALSVTDWFSVRWLGLGLGHCGNWSVLAALCPFHVSSQIV